jgi:MFS family permease
LLLGGRALVSALLQPLFGRLADRWDRTRLVIGGLLLAAVGQFLIPSVPTQLVEVDGSEVMSLRLRFGEFELRVPVSGSVTSGGVEPLADGVRINGGIFVMPPGADRPDRMRGCGVEGS